MHLLPRVFSKKPMAIHTMGRPAAHQGFCQGSLATDNVNAQV